MAERRENPPELRVPRPDESTPADEMTMARGWLTHLRESAIFKLEHLDYEQLRWAPTPTAAIGAAASSRIVTGAPLAGKPIWTAGHRP